MYSTRRARNGTTGEPVCRIVAQREGLRGLARGLPLHCGDGRGSGAAHRLWYRQPAARWLEARTQGYGALRERHVADFQPRYRRVNLDLGAAYRRYDPAKRVGGASVDGRSLPGASWKHENVD